jgi:hypothetical protein
MAKKVTKNQMTGDAGEVLVHRRVLEMGYIYHPPRRDIGIDGHIELRDSRSEEMLPGTVKAQSKGSDRPFPGETDQGFHFVVDKSDLEPWLASNAPVILVCSHPETQEAWWKPIKEWFSTPERLASRRVEFDKQKDRFDASAAPALMQLAAAGGRWQTAPPARKEPLRSNLLPLENYPDRIFSAESRVSELGTAWRYLRSVDEDAPGDWLLHVGRIISFRPLDTLPLSGLCKGPIDEIDSDEWALSEDPVIEKQWVRLLNRTLQQMLAADLAWHRGEHHLFFMATKDLEPRSVPGARGTGSGITVFRAYANKRDESRIAYYRHSALARQFLRADDRWYLALKPTYHFTYDGYRVSRWAGDYLSKIKRLERNEAVRRQIDMWARYLRGDDDALWSERDQVLAFGSLVEFESEVGIDDRSWEKPPPGDTGSQPSLDQQTLEEAA